MAAKVSKLDEQFKLDAPREKQKEGTCSNIFSGVAVYVNGYTGNIKKCVYSRSAVFPHSLDRLCPSRYEGWTDSVSVLLECPCRLTTNKYFAFLSLQLRFARLIKILPVQILSCLE